MMSNAAVVVPSGNAVEIAINWFDMAGTAEAPSSVQYQVFDAKTGDAVSALETVSSPAASMTFVIPGSDLQANSEPKRKLTIEIEGSFASDAHTEFLTVFVRKRFTPA